MGMVTSHWQEVNHLNSYHIKLNLVSVNVFLSLLLLKTTKWMGKNYSMIGNLDKNNVICNYTFYKKSVIIYYWSENRENDFNFHKKNHQQKKNNKNSLKKW